VSICDIGAGMNATIAVLSALALRERTGAGTGVAVSLFDGAADWMTIPYLHELYGKGAPTRQGVRHPSIAPYGAYTTRDGRDIVISIQNDREWQQFCTVFLRKPDIAIDERFATNNARVRHGSALDKLIAESFKLFDTREALHRLSEANTAFGQVRSVAEMAEHPALRTWPMQVGDRELELIAPAVRAPWDEQRFMPAPRLDQQGAALRREFGEMAIGEPS
jgi:crotonobetainyl-CoA:carnitine CoA-transferase CaiB-like acyl-CoA transferase